MAKYRQIGREVEAAQYTGTDESRQAILELAGIDLDHGSWSLAGDSLLISTAKHNSAAHSFRIDMNAWLARYGSGRFYIQQDDEFQESHIKE